MCHNIRNDLRPVRDVLDDDEVRRFPKASGRTSGLIAFRTIFDRMVQWTLGEVFQPCPDRLFDPPWFGYRPPEGVAPGPGQGDAAVRGQGLVPGLVVQRDAGSVLRKDRGLQRPQTSGLGGRVSLGDQAGLRLAVRQVVLNLED